MTRYTEPDNLCTYTPLSLSVPLHAYSAGKRVLRHGRKDELTIFDAVSYIQVSAKVFRLATPSIRQIRASPRTRLGAAVCRSRGLAGGPVAAWPTLTGLAGECRGLAIGCRLRADAAAGASLICC